MFNTDSAFCRYADYVDSRGWSLEKLIKYLYVAVACVRASPQFLV